MQSTIDWRRLSGIVVVQAAITLGWVIYALYLPDLLTELGFARSLAATLLIIEHCIEVVVEPIFGDLSDHTQQKQGSRLPWILVGIGLASLFFIALPAIANLVPPDSPWRWLLPIAAILWASAMAIFRSPMTALLSQAAPEPQLPLAASCLTLVQRLINSLRFTAYGFLVSMGPGIVFAAGSLVSVGAATVLYFVTQPTSPQPENIQKNSDPSSVNKPVDLPAISLPNCLEIIGVGILLGWGLRFFFASLAPILLPWIEESQPSVTLMGVNVLIAIAALPAGWLGAQLGNRYTMLGALVTTAVLLAGISNITSGIIFVPALITLSFAFSAVLNGMAPFVLERVPPARSGLGLGLFFGAFSGSISFFDLVFQNLGPSAQIALGAISFSLVAVRFLLKKQSHQK
ncbi:MAG: MFS transporter [Cyanobacteria bacterium P01_H01_bin.15]